MLKPWVEHDEACESTIEVIPRGGDVVAMCREFRQMVETWTPPEDRSQLKDWISCVVLGEASAEEVLEVLAGLALSPEWRAERALEWYRPGPDHDARTKLMVEIARSEWRHRHGKTKL
jgi:hypothetical protein